MLYIFQVLHVCVCAVVWLKIFLLCFWYVGWWSSTSYFGIFIIHWLAWLSTGGLLGVTFFCFAPSCLCAGSR